jgi:hypothetical protein
MALPNLGTITYIVREEGAADQVFGDQTQAQVAYGLPLTASDERIVLKCTVLKKKVITKLEQEVQA